MKTTHELAIDRLSGGINSVLIYGSDAGYVAILLKRLTDKILGTSDDPFGKIEFDYATLKEEPSLLADEVNSLTLFGNRKFIIVGNCGDSTSKDIINILQNLKGQVFIVFTGGELKKGGSTRNTFEASSNALVLPCYKNDFIAAKANITQYLANNGLNADSNIVQALANLLSNDRMILYSELEKLCLYKDAGSTIDVADLFIINGSEELALDDLCVNYALQNKVAVAGYINAIASGEVNFMLAIRVLLKYFLRLLQVKAEIQQGSATDRAMLKLQPPVFYKQKDNFVKVVNKLSSEAIINSISALLELETSCKTLSLKPELQLSDFLLR